jgi:DNA primase small subunit
MAAMEDIILLYTYPRLDENVSKKRNHLLKAPFCVHPKTGRICVPVDPERIEEFDPEAVPTIDQLLSELDTVAKAAEHHSGEFYDPTLFLYFTSDVDWERTSLKPYVDMLDRHNQSIMDEARKEKRGASAGLFSCNIRRRYELKSSPDMSW